MPERAAVKRIYEEKEGSDAVAYFMIVMMGVTILLWGLFVEFADSANPLTTMSEDD